MPRVEASELPLTGLRDTVLAPTLPLSLVLVTLRLGDFGLSACKQWSVNNKLVTISVRPAATTSQ